jgi:RNA polymerase sigma-70 factor (ECF subfamily)
MCAMSLGFERALDEATRTAERAYPGLGVAREAFVESLRARLASEPDPAAALAARRVDHLYLAFACAEQRAQAIAQFEADHFHHVRIAMARFHVAHAECDELMQRLRERLFVATPPHMPRIADYDGRGHLSAFVRAVAVRLVLDHLRRSGRTEPADDETLAELAAPDDDVELAHAKRRYAAEFRAALRDALATLDREARVDLKHYYLDGLTLEALAVLRGVAPSTIARRLTRTRELLLSTTCEQLAKTLGVAPGELDSVLAIIASHMEVARSVFETAPPVARP